MRQVSKRELAANVSEAVHDTDLEFARFMTIARATFPHSVDGKPGPWEGAVVTLHDDDGLVLQQIAMSAAELREHAFAMLLLADRAEKGS